jgi:acetyl esterase/lipase
MTDPRALIDPECLPGLDAFLAARPTDFWSLSIEQRRRIAYELSSVNQPVDGVSVEVHEIEIQTGGASLLLRAYRPAVQHLEDLYPAVIYIHGGGMVMGSTREDDPIALRLARELDAVILSVDYRLAPEHPYPAALNDCLLALSWIRDHAGVLGIDPRRLAIYGMSAGGGLALATTLANRDSGGPPPSLVMAIYPMLDDRCDTSSSHEIQTIGAWDREANVEAWSLYLGGQPADAYAAPARATDLAGLPPTFIDVGTLDLFRDECIGFAQRLMQASVPTTLHVYPGCFHGAELAAPDAAISKIIWAARTEALRRALDVPSGAITSTVSTPSAT